jgi:hypothetical protein
MMMYLQVHTLSDANLHWRTVEAHKAPQMPRRLTVFSSSHPPYMEDRSTMGPLRAVTEPVQAWGNLHNLIGGSQVIHNA